MITFESADQLIAETCNESLSLTEKMAKLIDYCESQHASSIWQSLKSFDYASDLAKLRAWLGDVLKDDPPETEIKAYWFGIYNPVNDDKVSCDLYLSGSPEYDPEDSDWSCWTDDSYLPSGRYANSGALNAIYEAILNIEDSEDSSVIEYTLCLGYATFAVTEVIESLGTKLLLSGAKTRAVVVGFDDGDYITVGELSSEGWE